MWCTVLTIPDSSFRKRTMLLADVDLFSFAMSTISLSFNCRRRSLSILNWWASFANVFRLGTFAILGRSYCLIIEWKQTKKCYFFYSFDLFLNSFHKRFFRICIFNFCTFFIKLFDKVLIWMYFIDISFLINSSLPNIST